MRNIEYIICYEKNKTKIKYRGIQKISPNDDPLINAGNPESTLLFKANKLNYKGKDGIIKAGTYGTIKNPTILLNDMIIIDGKNANDVSMINHWRWSQNNLAKEIEAGTKINCSQSLVISYKKSNYDPEVPPNLIDKSVGANTTEEAGKMLTQIIGKKSFDFPKDMGLIKYILGFICSKNSIILDCFAGSGTTGHAVLEMNKDGGDRKFILCEMMDYAESLTAERVRRVIKGYGEGDKRVPGTGGSFDYYELGVHLFNEDGTFNPEAPLESIKQYIWYSETKKPYPSPSDNHPYYIGNNDGTAYFLCYDKNGKTTLSIDNLDFIKEKADMYIIYADICLLDKTFMDENNIIFKKIPRDITRF